MSSTFSGPKSITFMLSRSVTEGDILAVTGVLPPAAKHAYKLLIELVVIRVINKVSDCLFPDSSNY